MEITRYGLYTGPISMGTVQVSIEPQENGDYVRHYEAVRELKLETEILRELLKEAAEVLGLPLSKEIDDLKDRIETELSR